MIGFIYIHIYIYILVWLGKIIWYMIILYDDLWPTTSTKLIYHSSTMIYHPIKCQARGKSDHLQRGRQGFSMTGRCFFLICSVWSSTTQTFPGCNMIFLGINQSETNLMVDLRFFWNSHFLGLRFFLFEQVAPNNPTHLLRGGHWWRFSQFASEISQNCEASKKDTLPKTNIRMDNSPVLIGDTSSNGCFFPLSSCKESYFTLHSWEYGEIAPTYATQKDEIFIDFSKYLGWKTDHELKPVEFALETTVNTWH